MARPSEGKPQDLQRKGRTTTASHGTLTGLNSRRHELLKCEVACLGVSEVGKGVVQGQFASSGVVEAVMVCAMRVNYWSSLCLC
jgi:hypothetical protein